jgi:hypothetical protein
MGGLIFGSRFFFFFMLEKPPMTSPPPDIKKQPAPTDGKSVPSGKQDGALPDLRDLIALLARQTARGDKNQRGFAAAWVVMLTVVVSLVAILITVFIRHE